MENHRKGLISIMLIVGVTIFLGALLGAFFWYQGVKNERDQLGKITNTFANQNTNTALVNTSNWTTYKNEQNKYEIKHPNDWEVKIDENDINKITFSSNIKSDDPFKTPFVSVLIKDTLYPDDACLMQDNTIILNNKQYRQQEEGCSYAGSTVATFFPFNGKFLTVSWTTDVPKSFEIYEAMLVTFQLANSSDVNTSERQINSNTSTLNINSETSIQSEQNKESVDDLLSKLNKLQCETSVDTSDWLTYTNTVFNYVVRYPKDYDLSFQSNEQVVVITPPISASYLRLQVSHFDGSPWHPPADSNFKDWLVNNYMQGDQWNEYKGQVTINEIDISYVEPIAPGTPLIDYIFQKNGQMFKLGGHISSNELSCDDVVLGEFIKSFKFL